ncbi:MAG: hypothetical protein ACRD0G_03850 [Acidimicrobiales bacterium]
MTSRLTMSPELAVTVDRARRLAAEAGELRSTPAGSPGSPLPAEAKAALVDWKTSGDYDAAVAEVVAQDPDLATQ